MLQVCKQSLVECDIACVSNSDGYVNQPDLGEGGDVRNGLNEAGGARIGVLLYDRESTAGTQREALFLSGLLGDPQLRIAELDQMLGLELVALDLVYHLQRDPGKAASDGERS
uniref:Uncharacterized protein n=1 Tax=Melanopsichium pennsylvanicum 4 TaxID=1398559 RepID=A0A077R4Q1_9BASI|nr:uncharacterized protein BN887_06309 [Melanopsichium pennsylvanicum 4]